jgi:hypothetical protein
MAAYRGFFFRIIRQILEGPRLRISKRNSFPKVAIILLNNKLTFAKAKVRLGVQALDGAICGLTRPQALGSQPFRLLRAPN